MQLDSCYQNAKGDNTVIIMYKCSLLQMEQCIIIRHEIDKVTLWKRITCL